MEDRYIEEEQFEDNEYEEEFNSVIQLEKENNKRII